MKNCGQFRELLEAYALDALDPEERAQLEAHLAAGCPDCAKTLEDARWLVSHLAYAAPEAAPSDMLKGRLMQTVRAEAQTKTQADANTGANSAKNVIPFWLWAAVAALLIFSAYSTWNMRRLQGEIRASDDRAATLLAERQKTEQQLAAAKREAMIMMDPSSVKIIPAGNTALGMQLEAKWNPELGIVVMGEKIPMPSPHHVLQLWFIPKAKGAKPMPSMMVMPDANGKFVLLVSNPPETMDNTKAIAITEEPEGGSPWPTETPRWVGGVG